MAKDAWSALLEEWTGYIERGLVDWLGRDPAPPRLTQAIEYSALGGGKRLRPLLVLLACDACSGAVDAALPAACAVEFIHNYSLIHDDLPAMDDDEYRRGRLTCHRQFDEATAILAGDALLTLAFRAMAAVEPPIVAVRCVAELAAAAGMGGMVGGQMDDMDRSTHRPTLEWLENLHARKTGALITVSLRLGGLIAGADERRLEGLTRYGRNLGLAFQIADDLLDVVGQSEQAGKKVHKDEEAGKLTYPGLLGIDESRRRARDLIDDAKEALRPLGHSAARLATLADFVIERDH